METALTTLPEKNIRAPHGIPLSLILDYAKKGLTDTDIATIVGTSRANISQRLAQYRPYIESLEAFKTRRADILATVQSVALSSITPDKLAKSSARDCTLIAGILYDKERLERGQTTENINILSVQADMKDIEAQKQRMREELRSLKSDTQDVVLDAESNQV